ncbi:hypothetical protein [Coprococcus sp. AF51-11b1]|uniref:hypothetical protein n=1 Tax=Coprococcus sp. AF51-11b1 TaxID=2997947 RepID=UPI0022E6F9B2|nr:hypothetical protein [Coprococcus sp. AF51-11b1]
MIEAKKMIKSGQEQAVASWINYLNQVRLDRLMEALQKEELNLNEAMSTIGETLKTISRDIVNNGKGRGGQYGMHGFIAEVAECGIGNAREQIEGKAPIYEWINDNGPEDLRRGATLIQQKFVNGGGHLSLQAIRMHLNAYPDFLDNGGVYQIPEEHYEKIKWLLSISEKEANKMSTSTGDFSLKQWREVHEFFKNGDIPLDKVEPSKLKYSEVQKGTYEQTFSKEKDSLRKRNQERKEQAYNKSKSTLSEGAKATAAVAAIEGAMALCLGIAEKRKSGKKFNAFDEEDWKEIAATTGKGTLKGSIRGASIYTLTNFTATPAAVASAMVTAIFGIAEQAYQLKQGNVNEQRFIENTEMLCLDASVSALSSFAGQILIPVPVLGAVIGNTVGTMMYQIAKDNLSAREQKIFEEYAEAVRQLDVSLQDQYQEFVDEIGKDTKLFMELLNRAFAPDIRVAFEGSIDLAKSCGVPVDEILDSKEKIASYFMD